MLSWVGIPHICLQKFNKVSFYNPLQQYVQKMFWCVSSKISKLMILKSSIKAAPSHTMTKPNSNLTTLSTLPQSSVTFSRQSIGYLSCVQETWNEEDASHLRILIVSESTKPEVITKFKHRELSQELIYICVEMWMKWSITGTFCVVLPHWIIF